MIAALYVQKAGVYYGIDDVETWDEARDARTYPGPYPVVAPTLEWGRVPDGQSKALVSWCGNHTKSGDIRPRVGKDAASRSPEPFRDVLLNMARSVRPMDRQAS